jgi:WS/DGAT/MGAT family acyltransferase
MTGALRRYLQDRGQPLVGGELRAAVPVNMRPPGAERKLGNQIGIVFLSLPIGLADPVERLQTVKRRMDNTKSSLEPPVTFGLLKALGMVPPSVQDVLLDFLASKATTLITNVIGPRERLYLAGAPIETIMFWVPQSGGVALGVSILSYAGEVRVGVLVDEGLVPDPMAIVDGFQDEFEALAAVAEEMPPASVEALSAILDEALVTLDGMLDGEITQGQAHLGPTTPQPAGRCQALTQAGRRCRNRALPDSIYCHIHR